MPLPQMSSLGPRGWSKRNRGDAFSEIESPSEAFIVALCDVPIPLACYASGTANVRTCRLSSVRLRQRQLAIDGTARNAKRLGARAVSYHRFPLFPNDFLFNSRRYAERLSRPIHGRQYCSWRTVLFILFRENNASCFVQRRDISIDNTRSAFYRAG